MKRAAPPATILEFLERLGIRLAINLYGEVSELYPAQAAWLAPFVREVLPLLKVQLRARAAAMRNKSIANRGRPALGPRLNQRRVTNIFRGINLIEAFVGDADWVQLGFARRKRDGAKIASQKLLELEAAKRVD